MSQPEIHYPEDIEYTLIKKRDAAGNPIEWERLDPTDVTKVFTEDGELIAFEIRRQEPIDMSIGAFIEVGGVDDRPEQHP